MAATFTCPQCGYPAERLIEGVCESCCDLNNDEYWQHYFAQRAWDAKSAKEKEDAIRWATR